MLAGIATDVMMVPFLLQRDCATIIMDVFCGSTLLIWEGSPLLHTQRLHSGIAQELLDSRGTADNFGCCLSTLSIGVCLMDPLMVLRAKRCAHTVMTGALMSRNTAAGLRPTPLPM